MQMSGEAIEIAARVSALEQAHNIIRRCGERSGSDIIRGMLAGYAMAYRLIDPADYAVLMRELCSFPPVRGGKLEVVVDNTDPQFQSASAPSGSQFTPNRFEGFRFTGEGVGAVSVSSANEKGLV